MGLLQLTTFRFLDRTPGLFFSYMSATSHAPVSEAKVADYLGKVYCFPACTKSALIHNENY